MSESSKKVRGASYPVIDLEKAVALSKKLVDAIGKASASKADVVRALGYSGINGKSKRVIAALIQYGLITGRSSEHKLTDLALQILFPENDQAKQEAIRHAAAKPSLFNTLIAKYQGDPVPGLLANILVNSHGINPNSSEEAARVFKASLQYAGMIDDNNAINADGETGQTDADNDATGDNDGADEARDTLMMPAAAKDPSFNAVTDLNRIEIVIREGVKAGIYAPYNLSESEKTKLKTIIDLL